MKAILSVKADTADKLNLLIQVAKEMGITVEGNTLSTMALPGSALTHEEGEKLAAEMEADTDFVNEADAPKYLAKLKEEWNKGSQ